MGPRLDSIIQQFLIEKDLPAGVVQKNMAVLMLQLTPEVLYSGFLPTVSKNYVLCAGLVPTLEADSFWIQRTDLGLIVCMEDPDKLLLHALWIAEKNRMPPLCIGLAYGEGIVLEKGEWVGIARFQSERISQLGSHQQVIASSSFLRGLNGLPEGVGALPLNKSTQELIGFPVVAIRDFRQSAQ